MILSESLRADIPTADPTIGVVFPVDDAHRLQTEIVKFPFPVSAWNPASRTA